MQGKGRGVSCLQTWRTPVEGPAAAELPGCHCRCSTALPSPRIEGAWGTATLPETATTCTEARKDHKPASSILRFKLEKLDQAPGTLQVKLDNRKKHTFKLF